MLKHLKNPDDVLGMDVVDVALIVATAIKWLVFTALLWIMIKIQKLHYHLAGLFASSLAATLVYLIPFVGSYLSYVVLIIGLWKCTGADIAPDLIFTVAITGALMFCFNLWVIGMLMGNLRPDFAKENSDPDSDHTELVEDTDATDQSDDGEADESESRPATQPPAGGRAGATAAPVSTARQTSPRVAARTATQAQAPTAPAFPVMDAASLTLKGVSLGTARPSVLISDGLQVHTVGRGESFTASLPEGRARLHCQDITKTHVILKNGQGQTLHIKLP
jgi:hypothetical protein